MSFFFQFCCKAIVKEAETELRIDSFSDDDLDIPEHTQQRRNSRVQHPVDHLTFFRDDVLKSFSARRLVSDSTDQVAHSQLHRSHSDEALARHGDDADMDVQPTREMSVAAVKALMDLEDSLETLELKGTDPSRKKHTQKQKALRRRKRSTSTAGKVETDGVWRRHSNMSAASAADSEALDAVGSEIGDIPSVLPEPLEPTTNRLQEDYQLPYHMHSMHTNGELEEAEPLEQDTLQLEDSLQRLKSLHDQISFHVHDNSNGNSNDNNGHNDSGLSALPLPDGIYATEQMSVPVPVSVQTNPSSHSKPHVKFDRSDSFSRSYSSIDVRNVRNEEETGYTGVSRHMSSSNMKLAPLPKKKKKKEKEREKEKEAKEAHHGVATTPRPVDVTSSEVNQPSTNGVISRKTTESYLKRNLSNAVIERAGTASMIESAFAIATQSSNASLHSLESIIDESAPGRLHRAVFQLDLDQIVELLKLVPDHLDINERDVFGNTAVMLACKLFHRDEEYGKVIQMLLAAGANPRVKDRNGWRMMDQAIVNGHVGVCTAVFDAMASFKKIRWQTAHKNILTGLAMMPDFYMEMHWEFTSSVIPLLSKVAPSDTFKIWKKGSALRLDTTLAGWKKLRSKRRNMSLIFRGHQQAGPEEVQGDIVMINRSRQIVFNMLEDLDEDEKRLVILEMLKANPMQGDVQPHKFEVKPSKNWLGKEVSQKIGDFLCSKYDFTGVFKIRLKRKGRMQMDISFAKYLKATHALKKKHIFSRTVTETDVDPNGNNTVPTTESAGELREPLPKPDREPDSEDDSDLSSELDSDDSEEEEDDDDDDEEEEEEEESSDAEAMEQDGVQQDAGMDDSDNDEEEDDEEEEDDVPANMEIESRPAVQSRSVPVNQSLMAMEDDVQVGTNSGVASKGFISTSALDGSDNSLSLFNFPSLSGRKHSIDELADDASDGSSDESDDDDEGGEKKKKSKRAKRAAKAREEKELRERETALMDERPPETADDFEKALLASPHSSYIWIQYMAFQLKMKQVEKAREVAEKALKTISFKEEREKLNVWVALLNLESLHGTPQSLQKVFDRACQFNEPKLVHIQMTDIHDRAGRVREADELYQAMCKRFGQSAKVFVRYALFLFKHKKDEEVKKLLLRALQSLAKRKHLKVISKFALLEFKYGAAERGRTMFEGILSSYPKRTDLWSIYIDMEIKVGNLDITRRLFERCISLRLSSKKMKFFFKRYLEFEKEVGTEETIEHVKQKAREYVESLGKGR
eukprot:GILJ01002291.1.p1 GENE.GILJ01002291.1~~GILJ01002291.1.p1  ORF type:complete len:1257 (+),score=280.24 GILJ01002291.1:184-3954(+)